MHCNYSSKTVEVGFGLYFNLNGKLLVIERRRKEMESGAYELEGEEVGREMVEENGAKDRVRNVYNNICMQCICYVIYKTLMFITCGQQLLFLYWKDGRPA